MPETPNVNVCIYNEEVGCDTAKCANCGWNPKVAAKRAQQYRAAQLQAKYPGKKLYTIQFTGYCEVLATSPEEAVEKARNEDLYFVRHEYDKPICLMEEDKNETVCCD